MRTEDEKKELLWGLRQQIVLGSIYTKDFNCSYNVEPEVVQAFFDSYVEFLQEKAEDDNYAEEDLFDVFNKYDNEDNLYEWYGCYEEDPIGFIDASDEDPTSDPKKAETIICDIINEADGNIYATYWAQQLDNRFNVGTEDMVIVDGWDDVKAIEEALCKRYFYFAEYPYAPGDGRMMDEMCTWGFADEYGGCDVCYSPLEFADGEYIVYEGERICFDCVAREYSDFYLNEYLPNHTDRANKLYTSSELEDNGFELIADDLASGMYEHNTYSPEDVLERLLEQEPEGSFIFSIISDSNPFEVRYQVWRDTSYGNVEEDEKWKRYWQEHPFE